MEGEESVEFALFREGAWKREQRHRTKGWRTRGSRVTAGDSGDVISSREPLRLSWGTEDENHSGKPQMEAREAGGPGGTWSPQRNMVSAQGSHLREDPPL